MSKVRGLNRENRNNSLVATLARKIGEFIEVINDHKGVCLDAEKLNGGVKTHNLP